MSIEQALTENTAALRELAAIITAVKVAAPSAQTISAEDQRAIESAKINKADDEAREALQKKRTAKKVEKVEAPKAEAPKAEAKADVAAFTYDDVKAIVLALSKKGREHAVGLLTQFGVENAQHLKPEQYAEVVSTGQDMLASLDEGALA